MKKFFLRWKAAGQKRLELDFLLSTAKAEAPLSERLDWLVELFQWMKTPGTATLAGVAFEPGQLQAARVRFLLQGLERNPEWKKNVARTLRSIFRDMSALDLFCSTGLSSESGFMSEAISRLLDKTLPQPPRENDLGEVFTRFFSNPRDVLWLQKLDEATVLDITALLNYEMLADEKPWNFLPRDMEDAFLVLAGQLRAHGLTPQLRRRMTPANLRDMPFFEVTYFAAEFILSRDSSRLEDCLEECRQEILKVYAHLDVYGVSINLVYQLERLSAQIRRIEILMNYLGTAHDGSQHLLEFLVTLIEEETERKSLMGFLGENLSLLSRKIAERSAETGHHYITKSKNDYRHMLKSASGGGALTAITALIKISTDSWSLPYFLKGVLASSNYAVSFVVMQFCGFTLATKQPAMTATTLAAKMHDLRKPKYLDELVDEITHLIRSQGAAILGNVGMVIPVAFFIEFIAWQSSGASLMSAEHARQILAAHSLLGPTAFYAVFTGVLLWVSSLISGWVDNWSVYRQLPEAFSSHRRLRYFLGERRVQRWADFYRANLAGFAANVSLGILLGMTPKFASFLGLPLDVRHVTLAAGSIAFAAARLGFRVFQTSGFWWAFVSIFVIGICNLGVSFFLAFWVATRARKLRGPQRGLIYHALLQRFKKRPLTFILPRGLPQESSEPHA